MDSILFVTSLSGSQKSSACFSLSEIDCTLGIKNKEESSGPSRFRTPNTPSRSIIKRKKTDDVINLEESFIPTNIEEATQSIVRVLEHSRKFAKGNDERILDMERVAAGRRELLEKASENITLLEKELKGIRVEHYKDMANLADGVKGSAAMVVMEARLNMASEVVEEGFSLSQWDTQGWQERLIELKREAAILKCQDPQETEMEKVVIDEVILELAKDVEND